MKDIYTIVCMEYFIEGEWKRELHYYLGDITVDEGLSIGDPRFKTVPDKRRLGFYVGVARLDFPVEFPIGVEFIKQNKYWNYIMETYEI